MVVDASTVIGLLLRSPLGLRVEARLFERPLALHAPHPLDVEVAQVMRRFEQRGELSMARSLAVLRVVEALPSLPIGTLTAVPSDVAEHLRIERSVLAAELFER